MDRQSLLIILIFLGLLLRAVGGQILYNPGWSTAQPLEQHNSSGLIALFEFLGLTIFMGLLKMMIIPLIAVSVIVGVTSVGDFRELGRLGTWTLV